MAMELDQVHKSNRLKRSKQPQHFFRYLLFCLCVGNGNIAFCGLSCLQDPSCITQPPSSSLTKSGAVYDSRDLHRRRLYNVTAASIASTAVSGVRFERPKKSRNLQPKIPNVFSPTLRKCDNL